jgi:hypothetical protein
MYAGSGLWWWRIGEHACVRSISMRGFGFRRKGFIGVVIEQHEAVVVASSDGAR